MLAAKIYDLPIKHQVLEKGLLHPGDVEKQSNQQTFKIRQPTNTLSKNFWYKMKKTCLKPIVSRAGIACFKQM